MLSFLNFIEVLNEFAFLCIFLSWLSWSGIFCEMGHFIVEVESAGVLFRNKFGDVTQQRSILQANVCYEKSFDFLKGSFWVTWAVTNMCKIRHTQLCVELRWVVAKMKYIKCWDFPTNLLYANYNCVLRKIVGNIRRS